MRKIPSLFMRERGKAAQTFVRDEVTPGCEWALRRDEKWCATRKWDGTCVLIRDGKIYARYDAKAGKAPPEGAIPCQEFADRETGHWPHWILATRPEDRWIREAFRRSEAFNQTELLCLGGRWAADRTTRNLSESSAARIAELETLYVAHGHAVRDGTYEACGPAINSNHEKLAEHRLFKHGESGWFQQDLPNLTFSGIRAFLAVREIEGLVWHHEDGRMCKIKKKDFAP